MTNATTGINERQSLFDIMGLGKPPKIQWRICEVHRVAQGRSQGSWSLRTARFGQPMERVEDQNDVISDDALEQEFGTLSDETVEKILEKSEQVQAALLALTEGEGFDIVVGAAPWGLEALRRLIRRWNLLSGGRRRGLLRQNLVPDQCKQDLLAGLEKWEELVRRYERSKSGGTTTAALDEDIRTAAFEVCVPTKLEQHFAMHRARPIAYDQVRSEIQAYSDARQSQFAFISVAAKKNFRPIGCGQLWQRRQERETSNPGPELFIPPRDAVCWHCGKKCRSLECRMFGEPQEPEEAIAKGVKRRPTRQHGLRSRLLGARRTSCSCGASAASGPSRTLWTWQRWRNFGDDCTSIQKVGSDGHATGCSNFRLFHWTCILVRRRKRMDVAIGLRQENSSPIMVA